MMFSQRYKKPDDFRFLRLFIKNPDKVACFSHFQMMTKLVPPNHFDIFFYFTEYQYCCNQIISGNFNFQGIEKKKTKKKISWKKS